MALASAVLAIDESADDCILVLVNLRKITLNLHRIFHIKANQWDKKLFYLNKEVCPDFFGSDRISTRASSIAPTDMFPSLFCFISFNNYSLIPISQTYVNGMTNDHWEIGGQVTLCTICLESSWAQLVPWISVPQSGQRKEGIAAFFDRWKICWKHT